MKRYIPYLALACATIAFGMSLSQVWTGLASEGATPHTYQLVSERNGDAYIIDHNLTAKDCGAALINESIKTVLRDAVMYCEVER